MEGRAVLCFPGHGAWFQGYFYINETSEQNALGLFGVEVPVDDCIHCCHGGYREYNLTIINYQTEQEAVMMIQKTGGDYCSLGIADHGNDTQLKLSFETSSMLTDDKAIALIRQIFPSISSKCSNDEDLHECIICIGQLHVDGIDLLEDI